MNLVLESYQRAPFFERYFATLESAILGDDERLVDLNIDLLYFAFEALRIRTPVKVASALGVDLGNGPTEINLNICRSVGAGTYLSGISGRDYLDCQRFADAGIALEFQTFYHPVYRQLYEPFVPRMSVLDVLFTHGPESGEVLTATGIERLDHVFE